MLASVARHDLVAESSSRALQLLDGGRQILDLDLDPIPAPRRGKLAVGHGLPGATCTRAVEQQLQIPSGQTREPGRWVHEEFEAEHLRIERDGRVDIGNDVSDSDLAHVQLTSRVRV